MKQLRLSPYPPLQASQAARNAKAPHTVAEVKILSVWNDHRSRWTKTILRLP